MASPYFPTCSPPQFPKPRSAGLGRLGAESDASSDLFEPVALAFEFQHHAAVHEAVQDDGGQVNHKRVDRLYAEAGLQVKKRRRKKIPLALRHPLERPTQANQVWSMDFVFDRTAEGRSIKSLTVVDDATHEAVAIVPERALGGNQLVRILERLAGSRSGCPEPSEPTTARSSVAEPC